MRTLLLTTLDGVMVVDGIGAVVPEIQDRRDDLWAIEWNGHTGRMVWSTRDEVFDDLNQIQGFLDFWDNYQPWKRMT